MVLKTKITLNLEHTTQIVFSVPDNIDSEYLAFLLTP